MRHQLQSIQHWLRVLDLCNQIEETEENLALGIEARAQLLTPMGALDLPAEAEQLFAEAREMAKRSSDPGAETRILGSYGAFRLRQGAPADSVAKLREAVRVAGESGNQSLYGGLIPFLSIAIGETGPLSEAIALVAQAEALYAEVPEAGTVEQNDPMSLAVIETNAAVLAVEVGEGHAALRHSYKVDELGTMPQTQMLAAALASAEKWREAEDAFDLDWENNSTQYQLTWGPMRALARYELGFTGDALSMLGDCAAHAEEGGARICELRARWMLAHLLIRDRGLTAEPEIAAALRRADSLIELTEATLFHPRLLVERAAWRSHA